ncbi:GNAT family N-acetyltransferase [Pseudonocardia sp. KRD-169]|uniref:GNAT family N-acetyltransferase n=1 Tax=Pseudonocardia abyssalis TaxID=2792008 RepID=A0ABS6UY71_9PSEU|nr:GNAT family N-acetyltransferase [Pseudonocardia abyssalis]MBW0137213.1 GNAT family N-acetyltransferase [Pseudonocardia abyssalis]
MGSVRRARRADLPALVALLRDDPLGAARESTDPAPYEAAFDAIDADPNQALVCLDDADGPVIGTLQLTVIPGLSRGGRSRGQIEAVRVRADRRGTGAGRLLVEWAVAESRRRGCGLVQLTTDRSRADAHRFYAGLGFVDSHRGFKLAL